MENLTAAWISLLLDYSCALAQLLMTYISSQTIHLVLNSSIQTQRLTTVALGFVFLGFNGGLLIADALWLHQAQPYAVESDDIFYLLNDPRSILYQWDRFRNYWVFFMFIWNTIPMNLSVAVIINRAFKLDFTTILRRIWMLDKRVYIYNFCQFLIVSTYYSFSAIMVYTTILQNDRNVTAFVYGVFPFLISLHAFISMNMTYSVRGILIILKSMPGGGDTSFTAEAIELAKSFRRDTKKRVNEKKAFFKTQIIEPPQGKNEQGAGASGDQLATVKIASRLYSQKVSPSKERGFPAIGSPVTRDASVRNNQGKIFKLFSVSDRLPAADSAEEDKVPEQVSEDNIHIKKYDSGSGLLDSQRGLLVDSQRGLLVDSQSGHITLDKT